MSYVRMLTPCTSFGVQTVTDEYEQGTYVYFDCDQQWGKVGNARLDESENVHLFCSDEKLTSPLSIATLRTRSFCSRVCHRFVHGPNVLLP